MEINKSIIIICMSIIVFFSMVYLHEYAHKIAFETVGCEARLNLNIFNPYTAGTCTLEKQELARPTNMLIDAIGYTISPFLVLLIILKIIEISDAE